MTSENNSRGVCHSCFVIYALTCRIVSLLFFLFAGVIRRIMDTLWFDDFWVKPAEANRRYGWRKSER